jgi:hypothetical protein
MCQARGRGKNCYVFSDPGASDNPASELEGTLEPASSGTPPRVDLQSRLTISLMNGGGPSD